MSAISFECPRCGAPVTREAPVKGSRDGIIHRECPESHEGRGRLHDAVEALRGAGGDDREGHLIDRLTKAFQRTDPDGWTAQREVLHQARAWSANTVCGNRDVAAHRRALDAIGLLWAWQEWQVQIDIDRDGRETDRLYRLLLPHPTGVLVPDDLRAAAERLRSGGIVKPGHFGGSTMLTEDGRRIAEAALHGSEEA